MYRANGKLLLTAEYAVLDGAQALAIPTRFGQRFKVKEQSRGYDLVWKALDDQGKTWYEGKFSLYDFSCIQSTDDKISKTLRKLLKACCQQNSDFLSNWKGYQVVSNLEFPRAWGLGSSSTLVYFMAEWADINPYLLLFDSLGGSGYDVACASAEGPILYTLGEDSLAIDHLDHDLPAAPYLYFVYTGKKQETEEAVKQYRKQARKSGWLEQINTLTQAMATVKDYKELNQIVVDHERILGEQLAMTPVKEHEFSDYWGAIKSLGAWGGDFIMATSDRPVKETEAYFNARGLDVIFPYDGIIYKG